jgi:arylsulfatase A-like enzyme
VGWAATRAGVKKAGGVTNNAPLRGGKGMLYEGGVRVPYLFRWPGRVAPGTVCDVPINSVDLYPTLLELAGAEAPPDHALDGVSYAGLLTGAAKTPERGALFWHFPGYLGAGAGAWRTTPVGTIRMGDWKLIEFFEDGRRELYNLREDVGEERDLAAKMPDKVKELHADLAAWRERIKAPMPRPITPEEKAGAGKKRQSKKADTEDEE